MKNWLQKNFFTSLMILGGFVILVRAGGLIGHFARSLFGFPLMNHVSALDKEPTSSKETGDKEALTTPGISLREPEEEVPQEKKDKHAAPESHSKEEGGTPFKGKTLFSLQDLGATLDPAEVKTLQSLSQRRNELSKREDHLQKREILLKNLEKRVEEKVNKLKVMNQDYIQFKEQVQRLLTTLNEQEEKKLKDLAAIYAAMAPKRAAAIWNRLDSRIIHELVKRLKVQNSNQILSAMDPDKASLITTQLAQPLEKPQLPKSH